jgi:hypothetical protein
MAFTFKLMASMGLSSANNRAPLFPPWALSSDHALALTIAMEYS